MYLLDTHVLLWWIAGDARFHPWIDITAAATPDAPLHLASITRWEVATLVSLGRLELTRPVREWLDLATVSPYIRVHDISTAIAAGVAILPQTFHRDPADRLIVATARHLDATVLTADERIIRSGLVPTIS